MRIVVRHKAVLSVALLALPSVASSQARWLRLGPSPETGAGVEHIEAGEAVGAVNSVAVHPRDSNTVYVGAVNGGVWETTNASSRVPHWVELLGPGRSGSIGAISFDALDSSASTVLVANGRFSSLGFVGGEQSGIWRSTDAGATWASLGPTSRGLDIRAVIGRGATIIAAAPTATNAANVGIWRSTDDGKTWKRLSGLSNSGLPAGRGMDVIGDPSNPSILYSAIGGHGVYKSTDAGAHWSRASSDVIDALSISATRIRLAAGRADNVYAAIAVGGQLRGLFRSTDMGGSWKSLDLPMTVEDGQQVGLHPGGQAEWHLSIAVDPAWPNIIYLGGDRQPYRTEFSSQDAPYWPNSLGAYAYSGRLFRVDANAAPGSQVQSLTHRNTSSGSAPHADSRDLAIAANGMLIEADDGGVYRRTKPLTSDGDWFSLNGDLQITEFHAIAWDGVTRTVIGGAQDNDVSQESARDSVSWPKAYGGDGGDVAVDDRSTPATSIRYSSVQSLQDFHRATYDDHNLLISDVLLRPRVISGDSIIAQFYTPIRLNNVDPSRMIIGALNGVYESTDQGATASAIARYTVNSVIQAPGSMYQSLASNPIAYGGGGNPDVLMIGVGDQVYMRKGKKLALSAVAAYPGRARGLPVLGVTIDPSGGNILFVLDSENVYRSNDAGSTWSNATGNLPRLAGYPFLSIVFVSDSAHNGVAVGTANGVYFSPVAGTPDWTALGTGIPTVRIHSLVYGSRDDMLIAGTLGRGAWGIAVANALARRSLDSSDCSICEPDQLKRPKNMRTAQPFQISRSFLAAALVGTMQQRPPVQQPGPVPFTLQDGVVIDPVKGEAYVMAPTHAVRAIRLATGEAQWTSDAAAKPLAIADKLLVTQPEHTTQSNLLTLVALDPSRDGSPVRTAHAQLPTNVRVSLMQSTRGSFTVAGRNVLDAAIITWQSTVLPRQGAISRPTQTGARLGREGSAVNRLDSPVVTRGAFRFVPATGELTPVRLPSVADTSVSSVVAAAQPANAGPVPTLASGAPALASADGRHLMTYERIADDRTWEKYRWTIYDRATGIPVGRIRSFLPSAPFFVRDGRVFYTTGPYVLPGTGLEPPKLRAVDIGTGQEVWSAEIRDTSLHAPIPP